MDAALAGGLVSAGVTLLALIIHKARCIVRCRDEQHTDSSDEETYPSWSCAAGFTESRLEPHKQLETVEFPENSVLYRKRHA